MTLIVGQERNEEGQGVGAATNFQLSKPFLVSSGQNASGFHENVMNIGLSCRIVEIIACGGLWQEILKSLDTPHLRFDNKTWLQRRSVELRSEILNLTCHIFAFSSLSLLGIRVFTVEEILVLPSSKSG